MLMTGEKYRKDGFLHKVVRLWNALPTETKLEGEDKKFKQGVKTFCKNCLWRNAQPKWESNIINCPNCQRKITRRLN